MNSLHQGHLNKTELWRGRTGLCKKLPGLCCKKASCQGVSGQKLLTQLAMFLTGCFVLKTIDRDGKFDAKSYEAIFLGYSLTSRAYRVYNTSKRIVEESIDVSFQESNVDLSRDEEDIAGAGHDSELTRLTSVSQLADNQPEVTPEADKPAETSSPVAETIDQLSKLTLEGPRGHRSQEKMPIYEGGETSPPSKRIRVNEEVIAQHSLPKSTRTVKNHPPELIIGDKSEGIKTRADKPKESHLRCQTDLCSFRTEFGVLAKQEASFCCIIHCRRIPAS
ncbi:hypothetical protein POM88_014325 [Heracleum sosnowskyi]|uniref:Retroviral polymerase SH3-like domain-containing protein n=1 Tax=Heracleum sosnowskyi TaxID=360622 RepID=A0AAD8N3I0_9APIA|nr:hypothetical protein POM88_014325 [Heracleum sosnowskyi]